MSYWKRIVNFLVGPGDGVRAKDSKGRFVADDKSTVDVNEAYKDGKTPVKKKTKTRTKNKYKGSQKPKSRNRRGRPRGSTNKKK